MKLTDFQITLLEILKVKDPVRIPLIDQALTGDQNAFWACERRIEEMGITVEDEEDTDWIRSLS